MALLALTAAFAVAGTKDYLAWNRVRWIALDELLQTGQATPAQIDGGYEFNGMYGAVRGYHVKPGKNWWWVDDDTYMITFGPAPGRTIVKEYRYRSWLHPQDDRILVLRRATQRVDP